MNQLLASWRPHVIIWLNLFHFKLAFVTSKKCCLNLTNFRWGRRKWSALVSPQVKSCGINLLSVVQSTTRTFCSVAYIHLEYFQCWYVDYFELTAQSLYVLGTGFLDFLNQWLRKALIPEELNISWSWVSMEEFQINQTGCCSSICLVRFW